MARRTYTRTFSISTTGGSAVMPNLEAVRISCATLAALSRALLGTQPVQVQSPPIRFFSTRATFAPSCAAKPAAVKPPEPAPTITKSNSRAGIDDPHCLQPAQQSHCDYSHRQGAVDETIHRKSIAQRCRDQRAGNRADAQQY